MKLVDWPFGERYAVFNGMVFGVCMVLFTTTAFLFLALGIPLWFTHAIGQILNGFFFGVGLAAAISMAVMVGAID